MGFNSIGLEGVAWGQKPDMFSADHPGPVAWEIHPAVAVGTTAPDGGGPQVFGEAPPDWMRQAMAFNAATLYAIRFDEAYLSPEWGVVFTDRSVLFEPSAAAARYKSPDLSQMSGFDEREAPAHFAVNPGDMNYHSGTFLVLNHWGGKNFGHFIFDSLPAVFLFLSEIIRGKIRILTSPLKSWQWAFLDRMGIPRDTVVEVSADICRCERIVFPSSLCDNLNFPSPITRAFLEYLKISGRGQYRSEAPRRIYVSREGYDNRSMMNEPELAEALAMLGFVKICPEALSIDDQISIFSSAEIIVGEIGAALSNVAFAPTGCRVIEIMPELKPSVWIKNLCSLLDFSWVCIHTPVPDELRTVSLIDGVEYNNLVFSYLVNVEQVLEAVNSVEPA